MSASSGAADASRRRRWGQLDFGDSGARRRRSERPCAALAVSRLAPALEQALDGAGHGGLYDEIENPLVRVLARMEHVGDRRRRRRAARHLRPADRRGEAPHRRDPPRRRADVQPQLADPAPRDPVRRARPRAAEEDQDRATRPTPPSLEKLRDQWPEFIDPLLRTARSRSCARPTARACSPRSPPTGASTPRSTRPWPAPAGCRPTSPTSTTSRCAPRRAGCSAGRSSPAPGMRAARRRLQPDRAALHRPPRRRPRADRRVHGRPGHPQRHRVADLRGRPGGGHASSSGRRRRWCRTGWPTAWRPTGSASA